LDLGVKNDRSAICILAVDFQERMVELANCVSWSPEDHGGQVDLDIVRHTVATAHRVYDFRCVGYDPWQGYLMAQQLLADDVPMREWPFVPKNKDLMARALLTAFADRRVALYRDAELERDLLRLRIKEGPVGFRLDAVRDDSGHADRAIAFSIVLPAALYLACEWQPEPARREMLSA
jgi:hypothetical protein